MTAAGHASIASIILPDFQAGRALRPDGGASFDQGTK